MAKTGLTDLFYCPITVTETNGVQTETLGTGKVLGAAIRVSESIQTAEAKMYANNTVVESVKQFQSGELTVEFDHISDETYAEIHGATVDDEDDDVIDAANDNPPFVRVGTIITEVKNGVPKYRSVVYLKAQFRNPNEESRTKGENLEFTGFTEVADLMLNADKNWRRFKRHNTYAEALAYVKKHVNFPTEGGGA